LCSCAVIHIIDKVLLPSAADLMEDAEGGITATHEDVGAAVDSLIDVATANNLTLLVDAVLVSCCCCRRCCCC
jgi:hypothetical protein